MWQGREQAWRVVRNGFTVIALAIMVAACQTELYSGLDERQANEMTAVLMSEGIKASRVRAKDESFTLRIDSDEISRAVAILSRNGLPRENFSSLGDIFNKDKMVSTPFEERARFMYAMNQELSESITQIAGVMSARVHIMLPESSPLDRNPSTARASVFIYHDPDLAISSHVPLIKNLIVNSIDGLNYEDVTVALFPVEAKFHSSSGFLPSLTGIFTNNILLFGLLIPVVLFVLWIQMRRKDDESPQNKWLLK